MSNQPSTHDLLVLIRHLDLRLEHVENVLFGRRRTGIPPYPSRHVPHVTPRPTEIADPGASYTLPGPKPAPDSAPPADPITP